MTMEATRTFSDVACSICAAEALPQPNMASWASANSDMTWALAPSVPGIRTQDTTGCLTSITDLEPFSAKQQNRRADTTLMSNQAVHVSTDPAHTSCSEHEPADTPQALPATASSAAVTLTHVSSADSKPQAAAGSRLLDQLLKWRATRARSLGVGPAALVPTRVLQDVARTQPLSWLELQPSMEGVPVNRLPLLGHELLDVVRCSVYADQHASNCKPQTFSQGGAATDMAITTTSSCDTISHLTGVHGSSDCETINHQTRVQPAGAAHDRIGRSFNLDAFFGAEPQQEHHSASAGYTSAMFMPCQKASSLPAAACPACADGVALWQQQTDDHWYTASKKQKTMHYGQPPACDRIAACATDGVHAEVTSAHIPAGVAHVEDSVDRAVHLAIEQKDAKPHAGKAGFDMEAFFTPDPSVAAEVQQSKPRKPELDCTERTTVKVPQLSMRAKGSSREHSKSPARAKQGITKRGTGHNSKLASPHARQSVQACSTASAQHPWGLDSNEMQLLLRQYSTSLVEGDSRKPSLASCPELSKSWPVSSIAGAGQRPHVDRSSLQPSLNREPAKFSVEEDVWIVQQAVACADLLETAQHLQRSTAAVKRRLRQHLLRPFPHARATVAEMEQGPVPLSIPSQKEGVPQGLPLHVRRVLFEALHTTADTPVARRSRQRAGLSGTPPRAATRRGKSARRAGAGGQAAVSPGRKRQRTQNSWHAPAAERKAVRAALSKLTKTYVKPSGSVALGHVPAQPRDALQLAAATSPNLETCTIQQLRTVLLEAGMNEGQLTPAALPDVLPPAAVVPPQDVWMQPSPVAPATGTVEGQLRQSTQADGAAQTVCPPSESPVDVSYGVAASKATADHELHAQLLSLANSSLLRWEVRRVLACKHLPPGVQRHEQVLRCCSPGQKDAKEVRSAFRRLSLLLHPDKHLLHSTGATAPHSLSQQGVAGGPAARSAMQDAELQAEAAEAFQMLCEALEALLATSEAS